jgi:ribosomal protein S27E
MKNLKEERLGQTKLMNCGEYATIIEYNNANDITVKFEDGSINKTFYNEFKNGRVRKTNIKDDRKRDHIERLGQRKMMNCGMECEIIKYDAHDDITVKFDDGYIIEHREYAEFLKGGIQNKNLNYRWLDDLTGQKFGRLTVLELDHKQKLKNGGNVIYWKCQCDCGNIKVLSSSHLKSGASKSCGCLNKELIVQRNHFQKPIYPTLKEARKDLYECLVNKSDGNYSLKSNETVKVKCPNCNTIYNIKMFYYTDIGVKCPKCSKGISYPNKFMYCVLEQLGYDFETERTFDWSNGKKYDFYIEELNCIIEAHGKQHYEDCSWSTAEEQQQNDEYKYNLAINNGIKNYIALDCRISSCKFIKNSILTNKDFVKLFPNIYEINWDFYKDIHTRKYKNNKERSSND